MFRTRPFPRPLVVTALACAMAAAVTSGPAAARELRDAAPTSSLAGTTSTTPEQDQRAGDGAPAAAPSARHDASEAARLEKIALAQERYYSSYGEPEPLPVAEAPAPVDEPQPWLPISIAIAAALTIAAASVMVLRRRRVAT